MPRQTRYDVLVESGPRQRKTMVHVPKLMGCVVMGPTTDGALEMAPDEIRAFLRWLSTHGGNGDPKAPVQLRVAEHSMEGEFLGQGGAVFGWDERTLTGPEVAGAAERWGWLRADVLKELQAVTPRAMDAKPASGDRALAGIAGHVLGAAGSYLSTAFGGTPEISRLYRRMEKGELDPVAGLAQQAPLLAARLGSLAYARARKDLARPERVTRGVRRLLEHEWEHLREIRRRDR
jgi:hypothetical protein